MTENINLQNIEQKENYQENLSYAIEQTATYFERFVELSAQIAQAEQEGKEIPESVIVLLEKYAPRGERELQLISFKKEVSDAHIALLDAGVKITKKDVAQIIEKKGIVQKLLDKGILGTGE